MDPACSWKSWLMASSFWISQNKIYFLKFENSSIRNGEIHSLLARELVPGDIIVLKTGDRVPAVLRLFEVGFKLNFK